MSTERITQDTTRNGWNPSTPISEDALDQVIEDSFPASDPPSHTPTTSLGAPKGRLDKAASGWRTRGTAITAGLGVALGCAATLVGTALWHRQARR